MCKLSIEPIRVAKRQKMLKKQRRQKLIQRTVLKKELGNKPNSQAGVKFSLPELLGSGIDYPQVVGAEPR